MRFKLSFFSIAFICLMVMSSITTDVIAQANTGNQQVMSSNDKAISTVHRFTVQTLDGQTFNLDQLRGKRILIVNTASACGFTPQYAQLQRLYARYGGDDFTILGFPSNDFGGQEPGSNAEIAAFCEKNYGVTFPMMAKISVKGEDQHPLFTWLTHKEQNGVKDADISWNFNKFLIDEQGNWIGAFDSNVEPTDPRIVTFAAGEKW